MEEYQPTIAKGFEQLSSIADYPCMNRVACEALSAFANRDRIYEAEVRMESAFELWVKALYENTEKNESNIGVKCLWLVKIFLLRRK